MGFATTFVLKSFIDEITDPVLECLFGIIADISGITKTMEHMTESVDDELNKIKLNPKELGLKQKLKLVMAVHTKAIYKDENDWEKVSRFVIYSNRIRAKAGLAPVVEDNVISLSQLSKEIMIAKRGAEAQDASH